MPETLPFETDPTLLALFADAAECVARFWADIIEARETFMGCTIAHYYAVLASGLLMAGVRAVAGYIAPEGAGSKLAASLLSTSVVTRRRETARDAAKAEARAWGLC